LESEKWRFSQAQQEALYQNTDKKKAKVTPKTRFRRKRIGIWAEKRLGRIKNVPPDFSRSKTHNRT